MLKLLYWCKVEALSRQNANHCDDMKTFCVGLFNLTTVKSFSTKMLNGIKLLLPSNKTQQPQKPKEKRKENNRARVPENSKWCTGMIKLFKMARNYDQSLNVQAVFNMNFLISITHTPCNINYSSCNTQYQKTDFGVFFWELTISLKVKITQRSAILTFKMTPWRVIFAMNALDWHWFFFMSLPVKICRYITCPISTWLDMKCKREDLEGYLLSNTEGSLRQKSHFAKRPCPFNWCMLPSMW